jgi:hypothetical protein
VGYRALLLRKSPMISADERYTREGTANEPEARKSEVYATRMINFILFLLVFVEDYISTSEKEVFNN